MERAEEIPVKTSRSGKNGFLGKLPEFSLFNADNGNFDSRIREKVKGAKGARSDKKRREIKRKTQVQQKTNRY